MMVFALASLLLWAVVLALPWRPWGVSQRFDPPSPSDSAAPDLSAVTVIIPARNEALHIEQTVKAVLAQGTGQHIIVVDDESTDDTWAILERLNAPNLHVLHGSSPPDEWSGKLWALHQGSRDVNSELTLLLDADIHMAAGTLAALVAKLRAEQLDFISLMAHLRMRSFWERLLVPAFVFFFKLLYPFKLANDPRFRQIAAAAGGCILLRSSVMHDIGGFSVISNALIDDCSLASKIKQRGFRTWVGLTHAVSSQRPYDSLNSFWNMVARTAFTQLRYSLWLLLLCSLLMLLSFLLPAMAVLATDPRCVTVGLITLMLMAGLYLPTLRYYRRSPWWSLLLPVVGMLFLAMTWSSAWRYALGRRSSWKGRIYISDV